ncbi:hypothetical protein M3147_02765 [Agromyces mediolanus]|uniref:hypothetical protein n=1 Tax=Agromyces mediolanus TaxID=41986 RepID=UPI00203D92DA|nr:hypothetical protein [Agromyces mediolanus]MCM3656167.1 hypothetical protein [Agromyces mediolanus]
MSVAHPRLRLGVLAATAVFAATALTGCFANPVEDLVNQGIEGAVEEATGGDVSLGGELPADFPDDVPLVDGEIVFAAGTAGEGWLVTMTSSSADPVADAVAALEAAGFAPDTTLSGADAGAAVYANATYLVLVAGDGENVAYTVTAKPQ